MPARFYSMSLLGLEARPIEVEADISRATLPSFKLVGLPDTAVRESTERVRTAIANSGLQFPPARVTVNLAPADVKKSGPVHDLAIALAIVAAASRTIGPATDRRIFLGELALNGQLRPISGSLPLVTSALESNFEEIFFPNDNIVEVSLALNNDGKQKQLLYPAKSLIEVLHHLDGTKPLEPLKTNSVTSPGVALDEDRKSQADFGLIKGQGQAKRALEIAAAGGHNILLSGPPGSGKTMLARALPTILPGMTRQERLEVTKIRSVAGLSNDTDTLASRRPFRSPHHTSSAVALTGGGSTPRPGEISLAHHGVLFLDELPEFPRSVLEALRQPLEDGFVTISRSQCTLRFPANFMLVAAMNPCPCGFNTDPNQDCICSPTAIARYGQRLSGPLLDRIDLRIEVPKVDPRDLLGKIESEPSANIRDRVTEARQRSLLRLQKENLPNNASLDHRAIRRHCRLDQDTESFLREAAGRLNLSARSVTRTLKLSRTIADLDATEKIERSHLAEALQFRSRTQAN